MSIAAVYGLLDILLNCEWEMTPDDDNNMDVVRHSPLSHTLTPLVHSLIIVYFSSEIPDNVS